MHQVLRVMRHDDVEAAAVRLFEALQKGIGRVQVVALRGRPVVRPHGQMDSRMARRGLLHRPYGLFVVGVHGDEHVEVVVPERRQIVLDHLPNDALLPPQRHQDGDAPLGAGVQFRRRGPVEAVAAGGEEDHGDEQVVEPANQDPQRHGRQNEQNPVVKPRHRYTQPR